MKPPFFMTENLLVLRDDSEHVSSTFSLSLKSTIDFLIECLFFRKMLQEALHLNIGEQFHVE